MRGPPVLLESGVVAGVEGLACAGEGQGVRFDRRHAQGAGFDPAMPRLGLDKRGVAPASFWAAFWRTVG